MLGFAEVVSVLARVALARFPQVPAPEERLKLLLSQHLAPLALRVRTSTGGIRQGTVGSVGVAVL